MTEQTLNTPETGGSHTANSLGLGVPEQSPAPADSFLLDPRETAAWFAALPMANIGETARQIYRTLLDFNRYQLSEMLRAKLVEQFRQPVEYICNNLHRHYMDMGFPLSDKAWKTAALSRELNNELAIAYKIVIERMLAGESERFDRKLLVIALHRALHYLGRVILQTALIYAPWPQNLFREINSLFAFAQQNRVHQVPIKMKFDEREDISTIEDSYKALLLLAAAAPYRLRQSYIVRLYQEARVWAPMVRLEPAEPGASTSGRFNINLLADEPPVHNALRSPAPGRQTLILDVRELLKRLREEFETAPWDASVEAGNGIRSLARPLLRQLIIAWNQPPERHFVRTRLNFELSVLCGLSAIYDSVADRLDEPLASTDETAQPASPQTSPFTSSTPSPYLLSPENALSGLSGENLSLAPLSDSSLGGDSLNSDSYLNIAPGPLSDLSEDWNDDSQSKFGADNTTSQVTTQNESAGGYCINWASDANLPRVKVGELLGIASATQRRQYSLGVVRWLRVHSGRELNLGLQIISSGVEAVQLRLATAHGMRRSANPPVNCLLLQVADSDPAGEISSIVMSNVSFPLGTNLWLKQGNNERMIRLTRLVELSSAFAQFQFSQTDQQAESGNEPVNKNHFDDLWNNL